MIHIIAHRAQMLLFFKKEKKNQQGERGERERGVSGLVGAQSCTPTMIHYSRHVGSCCKPPNQKQWGQHVLQPPSDLIKSIFSPVEYRHFSQKRKKAVWLQPSECTHRGLVQAYFSVCISPYIIHIHARWRERIFLFSSLMFICSENYHQETWIYCSPPSGWDRRFKLIVSHL